MEQVQHNSQQDNNNKEKSQSKPGGIRGYIGWIVLALILIVGGYYGYQELHFIQTHVDTEDAQTTGYISPVLPRVSGYVREVHVNDNEHVEKGQTLVVIDSTEYVLKVQKAKTALANARASLDVAQSDLNTAKVSLKKARQDYNRDKDLLSGGAITQQEFEDTQSALDKVQAEYQTAKQKVSAARTQIAERKNALDYAQLQLSYTTVKAPSSGMVSKKDVEVGQLIQPNQPLMAVTDIKDVWVVANFKETQIQYIEPGQTVDISVDAYPDQKFKGTVQSIAGGTGAKYALLPPDNATGNFVKVVQRVPVKIVLNDQQSARDKLRQGLNVTATIDFTQPVDTTATAMLPKND